eukprot:scaffold290795_cov18-Tisochrysis_lutea.AAC.1
MHAHLGGRPCLRGRPRPPPGGGPPGGHHTALGSPGRELNAWRHTLWQHRAVWQSPWPRLQVLKLVGAVDGFDGGGAGGGGVSATGGDPGAPYGLV